MYYLCSLTSFLFGKLSPPIDQTPELTSIAFLVSVALGYLFPVAVQKEFVESVSRDSAQKLCEDFIDELNLTIRLGDLANSENGDAGKTSHDVEKDIKEPHQTADRV